MSISNKASYGAQRGNQLGFALPIILIVLIGLGIGGFFVYKNIIAPKKGAEVRPPLIGNLFSVDTDQGRKLFFVDEDLEIFTEEELKQLTGCTNIYPKSILVSIAPSEAKQKVKEKLLELYPSSEFDKQFCVLNCIRTTKERGKVVKENETLSPSPETIAEKDCDQFCEIKKKAYDWRYPLFSGATTEEPILHFECTPSCNLEPERYYITVTLTDGRKSIFFITFKVRIGYVWYSSPTEPHPPITDFDLQRAILEANNKLEDYLVQNNIHGTITETFNATYLSSGITPAEEEVKKEEGPIDRVNPDIPSNFLYQLKSDKIPEEYLLVHNQKLNTELIYQENNKFYCKPSGEEAEKIEYFYHSSGRGYINKGKIEEVVAGDWYYRYAYICGNNYWILDASDTFGTKTYGPFEK